MNKLIAPSLFILLFYLASCQEAREREVETFALEIPSLVIDSSKIQYLFFLQEKVLEVWTQSDSLPPKKLETVQFENKINFPIGIYRWADSNQGLILSYPNAFYQEKLGQKAKKYQLSFDTWSSRHPLLNKWKNHTEERRLMVLPNDFRKDQEWEACFACPHWMAEVYGQLKVETGTFFD